MRETWYNLLLPLTVPILGIRLWWKGRSEPAYRKRIGERFAHVSPAEDTRALQGCIWFHTVSAGEAIAAEPLIRAVMERFPERSVLVTSMTPAGSTELRRRLGDAVRHRYAPYDYPWVVRRFFEQMQPRLLVLVETELWPNWLASCRARDIPVALVNARMSERSARGYRRLGRLGRNLFQHLDWVGCQFPEHATRFCQLGVMQQRVCVCGSLKFDVKLPADLKEQAKELKENLPSPPFTRSSALSQSPKQSSGDRVGRAEPGSERPVWIAASTHAGEEEILLRAQRHLLQAYPTLLLILAPRHPRRCAELARQARRAGFQVMGSQDQRPGIAEVLIVETMGRLPFYYGVADMAFIGGSLVPRGGHNMIEAAACGLPVVMGPSDYNFEQIAQSFSQAGCLARVTDAEALACTLQHWLADPEIRQTAGAVARRMVAQNTGTTARLLEGISALL